MAGRLAATVDGRPVVIQADDAGLTLVINSVRTAWAARKSVRGFEPVLRALEVAGIPVRITVAPFLTLQVLPTPSALARILLPSLSSLSGGP